MKVLDLDDVYDWLDSQAKIKSVDVEVCSRSKESLRISFQKKSLDLFQNDSSDQLGLRLVNNGQEGFAYLESFELEDLTQAFDEALDNSKIISQPYAAEILSESEAGASASESSCPKLFSNDLKERSVDDKIALAEELEQLTLGHDSRIARAPNCLYYEAHQNFSVWNTKGLKNNYTENYGLIYSSALTQEATQVPTSGVQSQFAREFADLDVARVSAEAADRALARFDARTLPSNQYPVLFSQEAAESFIQFCLPFFSSLNVIHASSLLTGKLNQKVFSDKINFIDDPLDSKGSQTRPFDGEGFASSATTVVEAGVLKTFLTHAGLARHMNIPNSGHCARSTQLQQAIGCSNFLLRPGQQSASELRAAFPKLVYVEKLKSSSGFNGISGQFSIEAVGDLIEQGQRSYPLKNFVLSGQALEVLNQIAGLGNELNYTAGRAIAPEILFETMMVAGG